MNYGLFRIADDFDYFESPLTGLFEFQFGDQLARARSLLANRSPAEIEYGLDSLNWLLRQGGERFMAEILAGEHGDPVFMNRPKALKRLVPVFDLADQAGFPRAQWHEYFALLGLACVGEVLYEAGCSWEDIHGPLAAEMDLEAARERVDGQRMEAAMEALEAVCYAEHLQEVKQLRQQLSEAERDRLERQREWGRAGQRVKMRQFDELRQRLLSHYDANLTNRTNRAAAKRLCDQFQSEIEAVLTTDDPVQQVAKWIGQHRRKQATAQTAD
jgi:hypothetical protein